MRKLVLAAFAIASLAIPFTASADDIPDGADCASQSDPVAFQLPTGPDGNADRGYGCVAAQGHVVAYIGGEARPENPANAGSGGACGAIIVADQTVTGDPDWDNAGADGEAGTADDEHCD